MISYSDFEFAIARWKSRAAGVSQAAAPPASGTVAAEVPVATAPEDETASRESGVVANRAATPISGNILLGAASSDITPIPGSDP
jgi:hypothetical protein